MCDFQIGAIAFCYVRVDPLKARALFRTPVSGISYELRTEKSRLELRTSINYLTLRPSWAPSTHSAPQPSFRDRRLIVGVDVGGAGCVRRAQDRGEHVHRGHVVGGVDQPRIWRSLHQVRHRDSAGIRPGERARMLLAAGCGGSPPRLRAFGAGPQPDLEPRAQFCGVRSAVFTAAMRAHFSPAALLQLSPLLSLSSWRSCT